MPGEVEAVEKVPLLQQRFPLWLFCPSLGFLVSQIFPEDWYEWRGGAGMLGWVLFLWGMTYKPK